jgi:hypothetical protein
MKVKELIEKLAVLNQEAEIVTANDGEDWQEGQLTPEYLHRYESSVDFKGRYTIYEDVMVESNRDNFPFYSLKKIDDKPKRYYLVINPNISWFRKIEDKQA